MLRLLENLRDISRLEDPGTLMARPISLSDIIRLILPEMQSQTSQHIIKTCPTERLPLVKTEPERIEQVLTNLIVNSIKYSPEGGGIEIKVRMVQDEHELKSMFTDAPRINLPSLIVSVIDQGPGIPEEDVEMIFERFYRVNNQLVKSTPGTGLGLYISRKIIESYGGCIWAGNGRHSGSVFCFSLPLAEVKSPEHTGCR